MIKEEKVLFILTIKAIRKGCFVRIDQELEREKGTDAIGIIGAIKIVEKIMIDKFLKEGQELKNDKRRK